MPNMSDEMLMAYADDALTNAERRQVEAAIAANPHLRRRLEPFVVTRSTLPEVFSEALTSPLPDRLLKTVMTAPMPKPTARVSEQVAGSILARVRAFLIPEVPSFGSAVALAAIVATLAGAGYMAQRAIAPSIGPGSITDAVAVNDNAAFADGVLATALETAPIAKPVQSGALTAVASNTFFDKGGRVCREYDVSDATKGSTVGFACRTAEGRWQIAFHAPVAKPVAKTTGAGPDVTTPAGDTTVQPLEQAIDAVITGDVLGIEQDAELLANGWRAKSKN